MRHETGVSLLARLLSDGALRQQFIAQRQVFLDSVNLSAGERQMFEQIDTAQLHTQAELLIKKRFREINKIIPLTLRKLGKGAYGLFSEYAEHHWPDSHRRHEQDAASFCAYLIQSAKTLNQSEWNRMRFVLKRRRWGLGVASDARVRGRATVVMQLLLRYKNRPREWRLYF